MISKRDMDIYQRKEKGEQYCDIALSYGLTRERVRQIYRRVSRIMKDSDGLAKNSRPSEEDTELYRLIEKTELGRNHNVRVRAYHCILREWYKRKGYKVGYPDVAFFKSLSNQELWLMQNSGKLTVSYLSDLKVYLIENAKEKKTNEKGKARKAE